MPEPQAPRRVRVRSRITGHLCAGGKGHGGDRDRCRLDGAAAERPLDAHAGDRLAGGRVRLVLGELDELVELGVDFERHGGAPLEVRGKR